MPPKRTPPAYHEQAKQLERRKTGDLLKAKIQQRPCRDELVRQHILEDISYIDPSLAERTRMLKKAQLADTLNDQISHRPGPLELIQKNIPHTVEPIEKAVKEGHISFKATSEGQLTKPKHPDHYITFEEDDSQSSEGGASSPPQLGTQSPLVPTSMITTITKTTTTTTTTTATTTTMSTTTMTTMSATPAVPPMMKAMSVSSSTALDVLEKNTNSSSAVVSLSVSTNEGADVVNTTTANYQSQSQQTQQQLSVMNTGTKQSYSELCSSIVVNKELQQKSQYVITQANTVSRVSSTPSTTTTTALPLSVDPSPMQLGSTTSSLGTLPNISIALPAAAITTKFQSNPITSVSSNQLQRNDAPGRDKNRKKSKTKSQPKTRTIKFHEYKGPPNAQKTGNSSSTSSSTYETSYQLLLQQQQLLLQWQVEFNNKFPQLILPANKIPLSAGSTTSDSTTVNVSVPSPTTSKASSNPPEQPPCRPLGKLEDMKVSDLKVELKRRNLPVSGAKPQLIERLKPFTEMSSDATSDSKVTLVGHVLVDPPILMSTDEFHSHKSPNSPKDEPMDSPKISSPCIGDKEESSSLRGDHMLKEHYRKKIEELHSEIFKMRSHQQLQQFQQKQPQRTENKLVLQQHLQNKMQQQNLTRQLQHYQHLQQQVQLQQKHQQQQEQQITIQQLNAKTSLAALLHAQSNNATGTAILDSTTLTNINNQKNQTKSNYTTTLQVPTAIVLNLAKPTKINGSILGALVAQAQSHQQQIVVSRDAQPPQPEYDDTTKLLKVKIEPLRKIPVKSQMVDDVLEILINSGELPPSAAQEPVTPTTPNRQIVLSAPANNQTQQQLILATVPSPMEVSPSSTDNPTPDPEPPSPPSLPLETYGEKLPSLLKQHRLEQNAKGLSKSEEQLGKEMLLNPILVQQTTPDPQPPQEVTSSDNTSSNLKDLGLDLATMYHFDMECDDIDDVPMDMDDPDWLESLMTSPHSPVSVVSSSSMSHPPTTSSSSPLTTTSKRIRSTTPLSISSPSLVSNDSMDHCSSTHNERNIRSNISDNKNEFYDPLLANSQDPFDLLNIADPDFKMSSDLPLSWDSSRVDFAT